jgi:hypothetical protein
MRAEELDADAFAGALTQTNGSHGPCRGISPTHVFTYKGKPISQRGFSLELLTEATGKVGP